MFCFNTETQRSWSSKFEFEKGISNNSTLQLQLITPTKKVKKPLSNSN